MGNIISEVLLTAKEQLDNAINNAKDTLAEMGDIIQKIEDSDVITEVHDARGSCATLNDRFNKKVDKNCFLELLNKSGVLIDLYGDSITEGVGATGHNADGTHQVIFNDYAGTVYFEGDHECKCWANLLRNRLLEINSTMVYTNRGIGGKSSKWCNENKTNLVKTGDIAFVQLGTNDRWDNNLDGFYTDLNEFLTYVIERYRLVILMSATPAMTDNDNNMNFNSYQMDNVITRIAQERNLFHISNLRDIEKWSKKNNLNYTELLQTQSQGSHPIDIGHKYIYENICEKLGISVEDTSQSNRLPIDSINSNTAFYDLPYGDSSCIVSDTNVEGLPTPYGGKIITHRYGYGGTNNRHSYQEFIPKLTNQRYIRIFDSNNNPTSWFPSTINVGTSNVKDIENLPIGIYANVVLDGANDTPIDSKGGISLIIKLNSNITFCRPKEIFLMFDSNITYSRSWDTNSWGYWEKDLQGKSETITVDFGTLSANEIKTMQITTKEVIDTNYYNVVCSLKNIIDSKVLFTFVPNHGNKNIWVTAHNRSSSSITASGVEINVSYIKM